MVDKIKLLSKDEIYYTASAMETILKTAGEIWLDIRICITFLTRLPMGFAEGEEGRTLAQAARAFPLVGAGIGAVSGLALYGAFSLGLSPLASAFVGLCMGVVLTGALHEDGLADTFDGFGGGANSQEKLGIMRDSHIGTYGVLAIVFSIGLRASALASMASPSTAALALIATAALSRAVLPAMMYFLEPARQDGLGATTGCPEKEDVMIAAVIGAALAFLFPFPGAVVMAVIAGVLVAGFMGWLARAQIGGYSGDVLGATQQTVEIVTLLVLAAFVS